MQRRIPAVAANVRLRHHTGLRVDVLLQCSGGLDDPETVRHQVAVLIPLREHPGVTVVLVRGDVELVDETGLEQHPLVVHHAPDQKVERVRQRTRRGRRRLRVDCVRISRCLRQLRIHLHRVVEHHRVDQRHRVERVLVRPHQLVRIAGVEEALDTNDRREDRLHDPVHVCHRMRARVRIVSHPEKLVEVERQPIKVDRVRVAEVVHQIARIVQVRKALVLGRTPPPAILLVFTGQPKRTRHQAHGQQAAVRQARLHDRIRQVNGLDDMAHVDRVLVVIPVTAHGGLHPSEDRVLPAVEEQGRGLVPRLQAEDLHGLVHRVAREHERQLEHHVAHHVRNQPRAVRHRVHNAPPSHAEHRRLHVLQVHQDVGRRLVQRHVFVLQPVGVRRHLTSDVRRGQVRLADGPRRARSGLDVATSRHVGAHSIVGILPLAGRLGESPRLRFQRARVRQRRVHRVLRVQDRLERRVVPEHRVQVPHLAALLGGKLAGQGPGHADGGVAGDEVRRPFQRLLDRGLDRSADPQHRVQQGQRGTHVQRRADHSVLLGAFLDKVHAPGLRRARSLLQRRRNVIGLAEVAQALLLPHDTRDRVLVSDPGQAVARTAEDVFERRLGRDELLVAQLRTAMRHERGHQLVVGRIEQLDRALRVEARRQIGVPDAGIPIGVHVGVGVVDERRIPRFGLVLGERQRDGHPVLPARSHRGRIVQYGPQPVVIVPLRATKHRGEIVLRVDRLEAARQREAARLHVAEHRTELLYRIVETDDARISAVHQFLRCGPREARPHPVVDARQIAVGHVGPLDQARSKAGVLRHLFLGPVALVQLDAIALQQDTHVAEVARLHGRAPGVRVPDVLRRDIGQRPQQIGTSLDRA